MFLANKLNKGAGSPAPTPDAQFNYVTMLLHGDGTNGAQNNTFLDSSTNNFTITRFGNTTQGSFAPYGANWSNYFDGSGDYLRLPSAVNLSSDFTVEAFVYSDSTFSGQNQIFGSDLSTADGNKQFYIASSTYKLTIYDGSSAYVSSGSVPQNQWSHVAISRQGSTITFYINGVASGTATVSATMVFRIVGGLVVGSSIAEQFKGYISNARIVSGTSIYNGNFTPSTVPLTAVSGTQLLTCQSNRFIDNSTNNYTLTVYGDTSVQRFNPFGTATAYSTSVIGGSGYFDGSGDNLRAPSNSAFTFGTGDYTIEAWVYARDSANNVIVEAGAFFGLYTGFLAYYESNGGLITGSIPVPLNAWAHVALSRSSGTLRLFVNGAISASASVTTDLTSTSCGISYGAIYGGPGFNGYISNVRVVKGTAVYTSAFTPPTAPLTAISGTSLLTSMTNGAIFDNAMINNLETVDNAQISTSVVKYGTGSLAFDGTGDYLLSAPSNDNILGGGNFTIEFWLYPSNTSSGYRALVSSENYAGTTGGWSLYQNGTSLEFWFSPGTSVTIDATSAITASTWQHVALCRASGTLRLFVNGSSVASVSNSTSLTGQQIWIGDNNSGSYFFNGYMDDVRITKGYARYTANFTPPTAAFPNTGPV